MAHPIQIILTRQLATYLSVPLFLVDPKCPSGDFAIRMDRLGGLGS